LATYPDFDPETLRIQPVALRPLEYPRAAFPWREAAWSTVAAGERIFALILLLALLPGLAVVALAIVLLSRRCPLIAHARVGQGGKRIWVLKLRTMWGEGVPDRGQRALFIERLKGAPGPEIKRSDDPRVTGAFAAACRKYSIDELPQLWHVVRGDLSLVGPRPMTIEELAEHYGRAGAEVLRLKPGLTGLWQVRGRSSLNYRQRRRLDLFLVHRWSLRLYLAILLATLPRVLLGKDAW
jgi:exopolysaccharide production protein ExoY